ncbi:MAG: hypothetical protein WCQ72_03205 [Eubacteriales bacterium]
MNRKLALILAATLFASNLLTACGDRQSSEIDETSSALSELSETTAESSEFDSLVLEDYGGYEFKFLTISAGINSTTRFTDEIYIDGEDGDIINDAVYKRNAEVEEKYNVKIRAMPSDTPLITAKNSLMAGDNAFDVMNLVKYEVITLVQDNLLSNWNDLPYNDFTLPWWNQNCAEKLTVNGILPMMSGSILISEIDDTLAMVYNKSLAENYGVSGLYSKVKNGGWTIDYMTEIIKNISDDLNGDGEYKVGDDLFGYVQDPNSMTFNWLFSSKLMNGFIDADNVWQDNIDTDRTQLLVDKMSKIFGNGSHFAYTGTDLYEGITYFEENKIFLYSIILRNVELLRSMDVDFGILPYPKLDERQEDYSTHVGSASPILSIPVTNTEIYRTSQILEAMAVSSYELVRPAYYNVALKVKMSRDEDSADMLDLIIRTSTYDISYINGTSLIQIVAPLIAKGKTEYASAYEKQSVQINKNMQKFVDALTLGAQ